LSNEGVEWGGAKWKKSKRKGKNSEVVRIELEGKDP